jgi:hypothetical protein
MRVEKGGMISSPFFLRMIMNLKKPLSLLSMDLRSLSLARFFLGILCFIDIANRIPQINAFYSDNGILPRWLIIQNYEWPWAMSLFNLNGSFSFVLIVSIIGMIASLSYSFGLRTKLSNCIVWIVIMSFHARFQQINHGGDNLLRLMLFWSLFLPMNAFYSFDSVLSSSNNRSEPHEKTYSGWGSAGWLVQTICVYFFTFLYKWDPSWFQKFDSVYYAMNLDMFTTPVGKSLLGFPVLMQFSSIFAFFLEGIAPILLIIPWRVDFFRGIAVVLLFGLHIGIWFTLVLGNFAPACLILWMGFIPSSWWEKLNSRSKNKSGLILYYDPDCGFCRKFCFLIKEFLFLPELVILSGDNDPEVLKTILERKSWVLKVNEHETLIRFSVFTQILSSSSFFPFHLLGKMLSYLPPFDFLYNSLSKKRKHWGILINDIGHEKVVLNESIIKKSAAVFFTVLIFAWNVEGITQSQYFRLGSPWNKIVFSLQLNQQWNMFAPSPMRDDGWWVAEGNLNDGSHWDILNDAVVNFRKKENVQDTYPSSQWRKFFVNLNSDNDQTVKLWFGKYLCRVWNESHNGNRTLNNYTLYFVRERTPPQGEQLPVPVEQTVWNHHCFN